MSARGRNTGINPVISGEKLGLIRSGKKISLQILIKYLMIQKAILKNSFDYFISILFDLNQLNLNKKIIKKKAKK